MAESVEGGQQEREASRYPNGLLKGRLPFDSDGTPERNGSSQGIHRFDRRWQVSQELHDRGGQGALCHQLCFQLGEFCLAWQVPKPEQMRDLLECRCAGQVVDIVGSIQQLPGLFFNLTDCGRGHNQPFEPSSTLFGRYSGSCIFLRLTSGFWHRC